VTCFNCYPVIRKHVIQPYYDQRGESNPEFAYKDADPDEKLFEDRAAEETPVKTKESRKKAKQSHKKHKDSSFELSFVYANYFSISPSESALR